MWSEYRNPVPAAAPAPAPAPIAPSPLPSEGQRQTRAAHSTPVVVPPSPFVEWAGSEVVADRTPLTRRELREQSDAAGRGEPPKEAVEWPTQQFAAHPVAGAPIPTPVPEQVPEQDFLRLVEQLAPQPASVPFELPSAPESYSPPPQAPSMRPAPLPGAVVNYIGPPTPAPSPVAPWTATGGPTTPFAWGTTYSGAPFGGAPVLDAAVPAPLLPGGPAPVRSAASAAPVPVTSADFPYADSVPAPYGFPAEKGSLWTVSAVVLALSPVWWALIFLASLWLPAPDGSLSLVIPIGVLVFCAALAVLLASADGRALVGRGNRAPLAWLGALPTVYLIVRIVNTGSKSVLLLVLHLVTGLALPIIAAVVIPIFLASYVSRQ